MGKREYKEKGMGNGCASPILLKVRISLNISTIYILNTFLLLTDKILSTKNTSILDVFLCSTRTVHGKHKTTYLGWVVMSGALPQRDGEHENAPTLGVFPCSASYCTPSTKNHLSQVCFHVRCSRNHHSCTGTCFFQQQ